MISTEINETSVASLKAHIFAKSWYQKKPSILGESSVFNGDISSAIFFAENHVFLDIITALKFEDEIMGEICLFLWF